MKSFSLMSFATSTLICLFAAGTVCAQQPISSSSQDRQARLELPDAPSANSHTIDGESFSRPSRVSDAFAGWQSKAVAPSAKTTSSPTDISVRPGEIAPRQTVRDKLVGSVKDSVSPFSIGGEIISAGYSHLTNGSPNFGRNAPAFGQRVGASVARGTSQNLFSEGVLSALLHEDPRYYQMGSSKPFFKRAVYAGTRPLITRTDAGRPTPNLALLGGYFGAAALTKTYYPDINQGFSQTLQTYGGSIGGSAIGFVVSEFLGETLQVLHLTKLN